jgi:MFS family permease
MAQTQHSKAKRRDLNLSIRDGSFYSLMAGGGESYFAAFVLALGFSDVVAGLSSTIPLLTGAILQLFAPYFIRKLHSFKQWVLLCALFQALSFIPLGYAAYQGHISLFLLFFFLCLYWSSAMGAKSAWTTWMKLIVPPNVQISFFSKRNAWINFCLLIGLAGAGLCLDHAKDNENVLSTFLIIFVLSGVARIISTFYLWNQSEPKHLVLPKSPLSPRSLFATLNDAAFSRTFLFMLCLQFCAQIASPYFTPYMLKVLGFSYTQLMLVTATSLLTRVLVMPWIKKIGQIHGITGLLIFGSIGISSLPILWVFSASFTYIIIIQILAGVVWAAQELATFLILFNGLPESKRTEALTAFSFLETLCTLAGSMLGGLILSHWHADTKAYFLIFGISTLLRFAMVGFFLSSRKNQKRVLN